MVQRGRPTLFGRDGGVVLGDERGEAPQDAIEVVQDLLVAEADHAVVVLGEMLRPRGIVIPTLVVHVTVDLNDESQTGAVEIGHVGADRVLPPELQPMEAPTTQRLPQGRLGRGLSAPELAGCLIERPRRASHPSRRRSPPHAAPPGVRDLLQFFTTQDRSIIVTLQSPSIPPLPKLGEGSGVRAISRTPKGMPSVGTKS